jgi:type I restriction enzyme, S subunit
LSELVTLPKGWVETKFDTISFLITKGSTPTTYGYNFLKEGINFVKVENIINDQINISSIKKFISKEANEFLKRSQLKEKDILFSIAGTIGRTTVVKKENLPANTNQAIAIIRCPWQDLDSKFIKIILDSPSLFSSFSQNRRGVGIDNVSLGDIREMIFPLPPLNEQKRIVSKIEELFSELDHTKETLQKIKLQLVQYRQSLLKSAFKGIDKKYETKKLENVCTKITDGTHHTPKYENKGVSFISVKDIRNEKIYFDNCKYVSQETHNELIKRCNPEFGDILITKSGTIGRMAIVDTKIPFSLFVSVALLKPMKIIDKKYLKYNLQNFINHIDISQQIKGGLIKNFHLEDIRQVEIPLPSLNEQKEIVLKIEQGLSKITITENITTTLLKQLETLRSSILKQAFEGKLVPQDDTDEPAEKLLQRIKEQKSKQTKTKSRGKK